MGESTCACGCNKIVYTCSGASNLGQACNELALRITEERRGRIGCLAGVGGKVNNMVLSAQNAELVIALDGCSVGCGRKILEQAGVTPNIHIIASDLDLIKFVGQRWTESQVRTIEQALDVKWKALNGSETSE
jgi:uncharacterized metal-binding protein